MRNSRARIVLIKHHMLCSFLPTVCMLCLHGPLAFRSELISWLSCGWVDALHCWWTVHPLLCAGCIQSHVTSGSEARAMQHAWIGFTRSSVSVCVWCCAERGDTVHFYVTKCMLLLASITCVYGSSCSSCAVIEVWLRRLRLGWLQAAVSFKR